jgi:NADH:ubiquinone oxidoreductase subunit E
MGYRIRICQGVNCKNYLSDDLFKHAEKLAKSHPEIIVEQRGCMDKCSLAPNMQIINESTGESEIVTGIDYKIIENIIKKLI